MVHTSMNCMNIVIIGAGIAGLKAALDLSADPRVRTTILEKSPSVGGRVATRRFARGQVNHGIPNLLSATLGEEDADLSAWLGQVGREGAATALPKALRDSLSERGADRIQWRFKTRALMVREGRIYLDSGAELAFDRLLVTAPVPQARELLDRSLLPHVTYSKKVLFVGERADAPERWELSDQWSEANFECGDEELRARAQRELGRDLAGLDLKKWRYGRVTCGHTQDFYQFSRSILLAGDAFSARGNHNLCAAWASGRAAASFLRGQS